MKILTRLLDGLNPQKKALLEWWKNIKNDCPAVRAGESFGPYKFLGWGFGGMIEDSTYDWNRHTTYTNYVEDIRCMLEYKGNTYAKKMRRVWEGSNGLPNVGMTTIYALGDGPPFVLIDKHRNDRLIGKYYDGTITVYLGDFHKLMCEKFEELDLYPYARTCMEMKHQSSPTTVKEGVKE